MRTDIHPTYYKKAKVTCACGRTFEIGSTVEEMTVEICSACHPFYTGVEKIVDTAGRVEKFKARLAEAESRQTRTATAKTTAGKQIEAVKKTVKRKIPSADEGNNKKSGK